MYENVGMYGSTLDQTHATASVVPPLNPKTDAVRGFGYNHDGAIATMEHFFSAVVFIQATDVAVRGGYADGDELLLGSDPANPASTP